MAEEKELKNARIVFETFCAMLDGRKWKYEKDAENLRIETSARGDDLPMDLDVRIDVARQLITLLSRLPFEVPEAKRAEAALAVSAINYVLVDGSFDYDYTRGILLFRLTSSFRSSLIGKDLCDYIIGVSCCTVDEYNDKFFMYLKDKISLDQFIKEINE